MLDPRRLRNDLENTAGLLARRGITLDVQRITELETRRKTLQVEAQDLQNQRNSRSKQIGKAKAAGEDIKPLLAEVADFGENLKRAEEELSAIQEALEAMSLEIPNIPHATVPEGNSENDNREERRWGEPPVFEFTPKDHVDLGMSGGGMDFEAAVKVTGSRFVILQGPLAALQRAPSSCSTPIPGNTDTGRPMSPSWSMRTVFAEQGSCRNSSRTCSDFPGNWIIT